MSGLDLSRRAWSFAARWVDSDKLWRLLDHTGIVVFVGPNGSGKSLAAVLSVVPLLSGHGVPWECWDDAHRHHDPYRVHRQGCRVCPGGTGRLVGRGVDLVDVLCPEGLALLSAHAHGLRLVYSTVELLDPATGDPADRFRPLVDYRQLLTIEHADVLFDEVAGVSDASESAAIPVQVVQWLHTLRKADVRLRVTTPAYSRCSKPVRQVAQLVVDARSYSAERAVSGRLWRPRRAFVYSAYDAFAFEDFTAGTAQRASEGKTGDKLRVLARAVFWRPGHPAERTYSTLGQVLALGHVTDSGMCSNCGGHRPRPACECPTDLPDGVQLHVVERVTSGGRRIRQAVPFDHEGDVA